MLVSPLNSRERILVMGGPGSGKSYGALSIAKKCEGKLWVIDNDVSWGRMLELGEGVEDGKVELIEAWDWNETKDAVKKVSAQMGRDDWLVIDMLTPTWQMVQDWFAEELYGKDLAEMMLDRRRVLQGIRDEGGKAASNVQVFDGYTDWSVINPEYRRLQTLLLRCPGHVYCTAEVDALDRGKDDESVVALYGSVGVKPRGQKRTGHIFHTIILMKKRGKGEWVMTSVNKDRVRQEMENVVVGEFATRYLMGVAGWKQNA